MTGVGAQQGAELRSFSMIGPGTDRVEALWALACTQSRLAGAGEGAVPGAPMADDWMGYAVRCLTPAFRGADMGHLMTLDGIAGFHPGTAAWQCVRCERRASAGSGKLSEAWGSALHDKCDRQLAMPPPLVILQRVRDALWALA